MAIGVGVSGGMDSLLSLLLLREQGHDVKAVHAHFLPPSSEGTQVVEKLDAACQHLDISFHTVDLHKEFHQSVIQPFMEDYKAGLTPNPCAVCNPRMKFGALFHAVQEMGCDSIATGHYVDIRECRDYGVMLCRGADLTKDQSYFLSLVPIDILRRAHFPLATTYKKDVLALLAQADLEPPLPSESQEICFVPRDDYQSFLTKNNTMPPGGSIVLSDGTCVGQHRGLWRHTLGQRRGLGIGWPEALYVLGKDIKKNHLIVGPKKELASVGCVAGQINLMAEITAWPEVVMLQTRYRQKAKPSHVILENGKLEFHFIEPHVRPTPGQVAVAYTPDGIVLGGGIIERGF